MAWHVNVRVVAVVCLILDVGDRDRNATLALFGCLINIFERCCFTARGLCQDLGDSSSQCGLTMVDMAHGSHIHVRLSPLKLLFGHDFSPVSSFF